MPVAEAEPTPSARRCRRPSSSTAVACSDKCGSGQVVADEGKLSRRCVLPPGEVVTAWTKFGLLPGNHAQQCLHAGEEGVQCSTRHTQRDPGQPAGVCEDIVGVEVRGRIERAGGRVLGAQPECWAVHSDGSNTAAEAFGEKQRAVATHRPAAECQSAGEQLMPCKQWQQLVDDHALRIFPGGSLVPVAVVSTVHPDERERRYRFTYGVGKERPQAVAAKHVAVVVTSPVQDKQHRERGARRRSVRVGDRPAGGGAYRRGAKGTLDDLTLRRRRNRVRRLRVRVNQLPHVVAPRRFPQDCTSRGRHPKCGTTSQKRAPTDHDPQPARLGTGCLGITLAMCRPQRSTGTSLAS